MDFQKSLDHTIEWENSLLVHTTTSYDRIHATLYHFAEEGLLPIGGLEITIGRAGQRAMRDPLTLHSLTPNMPKESNAVQLLNGIVT